MSARESERPKRSVAIESSECHLPSSVVTTVKSFALPANRTLQVPVQAIPVEVHDVPLLRQPVEIYSHQFVSGLSAPSEIHDREVRTPSRAAVKRKRTRIQPPQDVVKLSERLFYLLQPDLETLLAGCHLSFPHEPFPFQFDGMAFLMPRFGGILADEMGLGKSMQAISSLRLLVHSGQARSVLVICPKGLVSNWARELSVWAPELVVGVIAGDPERRRWQWSLQDVPVKVAHYEAVIRDRPFLDEMRTKFDLVILD